MGSLRRISTIISSIALFCLQAPAQTVVTIGSGSYASEPPAAETYGNNQSVNTWATNPTIWVMDGETRPLPTNKWWTDILVNQYGAGLWAYPYYAETHNKGMSFFFAKAWNGDGSDMIKGTALVLKGQNFAPTASIPKDWSDWTLQVRLPQGGNYMDVTMAHGIPMIWVETQGVVPQFDAVGATFTDSAGQAVQFPYTGKMLRFIMDGKDYGVFASAGTRFQKNGNEITLELPSGKQFFSFAFLPTGGDFGLFARHALVIPRGSSVSWDYNPAQGILSTSWTLSTVNLDGGSETDVIQGFLPHHYKRTLNSTALDGPQYLSPRGSMKCAIGKTFSFAYRMPGILASYPEPTYDASETNPYDPAAMTLMLDRASTKTGYGNDTYWGGKDVLTYAKTAQLAKETGHSAYNSLLNKAKTALTDWFTYSPGEAEHYFAYYPKWKALIGFNSSYGSETFNDQHFHYGYFTHAAALVGLMDRQFVKNYQGILTMIAKQYANWDRSSTQFPFLRTMDVWMGHSYAGGLSSGGGNNQESTSEAMQSWAGLFLLGNVLGDDAMRAAGAFGYLSESRATLEYWFDWDNENLSPNYAHTMVGVLWAGGNIYGTYFSADPHHIHGIQYLPVMPAFQYLGQDTAWARSEYNTMMAETQAAKGWTDETQFGNDWANVALGFHLFFDPTYVTAKYKTWLDADNGASKDDNSPMVYYYAHFLQNQGAINWDFQGSLPSSQAYYNQSTQEYRFVAYNYADTTAICWILKDGVFYDSLSVPPHAYADKQWASIPTPLASGTIQRHISGPDHAILSGGSWGRVPMGLQTALQSGSSVHVQVVNLSGQQVQKADQYLKNRDGTWMMDASNWAPGSYVLHWSAEQP